MLKQRIVPSNKEKKAPIDVRHDDQKCDSLFKRTLKLLLKIIFIPIIAFLTFSLGYDQWLIYYREGTYGIPHSNVVGYTPENYPHIGSVEILTEEGNKIFDSDSVATVLGSGFKFVEGPVWNYYSSSNPSLFFSDIYDNCIYQWNERDGFMVYQYESGTSRFNAYTRKEPGSNGLAIDPVSKDLFICQHGNRNILRATLNFDINTPAYKETPLLTTYEGHQFNSPNDLAFTSKGDFFFTDPPYGLPTQDDRDPTKELSFNGIYRWSHDTNQIELLYDNLTRPNGIAVSPDQHSLFVSCSDPQQKAWFKADLDERGIPTHFRLFYDGNHLDGEGLPDGLTVDTDGYVFVTGPGGVHVLNAQAERIAVLHLPQAPTNVAFGDTDEEGHVYLYITMQSKVLRIPTYSSGMMKP